MGFIRLDRARRRWPAIGVAPMVAVSVWTVLVGVFVLVKPADSDATLCMFRNTTGLPCPACGSTRAALAVAGGRPLDAVALNPLVTIAAVLGAAWLVMRVGFARQLKIDSSSRAAVPVWTALAVLMAANWIYVIARHGPY
jgi:hypothetical protein